MIFDVKLVLAKLNRTSLDEEAHRKSMDLSSLTEDMVAATEVVGHTLVDLARRLNLESIRFSKKGAQEISEFQNRSLANDQLALNVMMTQNPDEGRELIEKKRHSRCLTNPAAPTFDAPSGMAD